MLREEIFQVLVDLSLTVLGRLSIQHIVKPQALKPKEYSIGMS
jgi:hypothetical protein